MALCDTEIQSCDSVGGGNEVKRQHLLNKARKQGRNSGLKGTTQFLLSLRVL